MGNKLFKSNQSKQQNTSNNNNQNCQVDEANYNNNSGIQQQYIHNYSNSNAQKIRRLNKKPEDANKQTVAVIVTFSQSGTYDALFQSVQQKAEQGTKVLVYSCSSYAFKSIHQAFDGKYQNDTFKELITQINKVDPDCVVFNWECCGHYSGQKFTEGKKELLTFVKKMLDKKFMCMFSDFSLKALIQDWDQQILGPNPFEKVGQTSSTVELRFISGQLKQCPSAQLQTVGQMAEEGKVNVHTMGGTIMYSVNKKKADNDKYKLKVLTVAVNMKVGKDNLTCKIGTYEGAAGHVLITYPSGGNILTSMTHWIQLMKVDTSQQKLFEVAAREYGQQYVQKQRMEYDNLQQSQKVSWRANKAKQYIQNQAPCSNMRKKAR